MDGAGVSRNQPDSSSDFMIRVALGPDGSWQGRVEHVQSGSCYHFDSYLEMVLFVQEMLEKFGLTPAGDRLRSWQDKQGSP